MRIQILHFTLTAILQSLNFKMVIFKSDSKSFLIKTIYHYLSVQISRYEYNPLRQEKLKYKIMTKMYHYASVSKALDELNEKGFTYDFNLHEEDIVKNPQKYEIKHIYRYEGNTDPGDESIVYGIQSTSGRKGVFVAGFAANSISDATQALVKISIKDRQE